MPIVGLNNASCKTAGYCIILCLGSCKMRACNINPRFSHAVELLLIFNRDWFCDFRRFDFVFENEFPYKVACHDIMSNESEICNILNVISPQKVVK